MRGPEGLDDRYGEGQPAGPDNYLCYTIKLTQAFTQIAGVTLTDQFTDYKMYNLAQPYNLSVPASVEGSVVQNPNMYPLCYKVLRVSGQGDFVTTNGLYLNNAFGPERSNTEKEEDFCVPATVEVL